MNKKGFTLVELLATIVVLGIISAISMVSVDRMIDHSKKTECDNILLSIKTAAKDYVSDNKYKVNSMSDLEQIKVSKLIEKGYLTSPVTNPFTGKDLTSTQINNIIVYIKIDDYEINYDEADHILIKNGVNIITCSEQVKSGFVRFPG